ncbi:LysM peptidoglycan-binding domain-containing protein [Nitratifractor sp.]
MKVRTITLAAILYASQIQGARTPATGIGAHELKNASQKQIEYTVQTGDSLLYLALKYHTTVRKIQELNKLGDSTAIRIGQVLLIPIVRSALEKKAETANAHTSKQSAKQHSASTDEGKRYTVAAGDTLLYIAHKHGVSLQALLEANHLQEDSLIRVGQELVIPSPQKAADGAKAEKSVKKMQRKQETAQAHAPSVSNKKQSGEYIVVSGDTLFSIARRFHVGLKALMDANNIAPTDVIRVGQKLTIPGASRETTVAKATKPGEKKIQKPSKKTEAKAQAERYYTVQHGDSLWKIAKVHHLTLKELRKLNHFSRKHVIHTGEKILVAKAEEKKAKTETGAKKTKQPTVAGKGKIPKHYTVKHGDSLWKIAKAHGLTIAQLREMNGLKKHTPLRSGMKLVVGYESPKLTAKVVQTTKKKAKKIAKTAKKKEKKKTRIARKGYERKGANRRITDAMAVLNGGGGGGYDSRAMAIIRTAKRYLGRRYVWGAEGPYTFDCSGFTQYVMKKSRGITLPRVSRKQAYYGRYVSYRNLKPGDLVFFDTSRRRRGYVNHVGIYIGNHKFIHASSARHRVVITSFITHPFYRARFKWGRRVN